VDGTTRWNDNAMPYKILVDGQFIENAARVYHGINAENGHVAALVELHLPSLAKVKPTLDLVKDVFLECTMDRDPDKGVEEDS